MKRFLLIFVPVAFLTLSSSSHATDALYHNIGTVICDNPPQVDASVFLNDGSFCAQVQLNTPFTVILNGNNTALPYTTQNTLWFTNNSIMQAGPGFQLDYITDDGIHHPAASIVNGAGGASGPGNIFGTEFVLLSATNLVNKGLLEVGTSGLMQLSGQNLNLARGGLLVDAASSGGACIPDTLLGPPFITATNFIPFSGAVFDDYWGAGTVTNLASDQIIQQRGSSIAVQSPRHAVTNGGGFTTVVGPLASPSVFVRTNSTSSTNMQVQVVFVGSSLLALDTNITTRVRFLNNTYPDNIPPNNGFRTAAVEFRSVAANPVTGQPIIFSLYLVDQLATTTNLNTLTNLSVGTQRPAPYIVDIYPPCSFSSSPSTNAAFTNTMVYNPSYSNRVVAASYAGYEAFLATGTGGGTLPTNSPGRIEITASNLDLTQTRIRGESIVTVQTPHLLGSKGLIVDAANVNYNIGSTNGLLSVSGSDLALPSIQRFGGTIDAWSGFWTNQSGVVVTNIGPDPNDTNVPPMTVTNLATNVVEIDIHVLIVDAGGLSTTSSSFINDFSAKSTNIVLDQTIDANAAFSLSGDSLTVNGRLILETSDWASTNIHLKSLTNNGTINVPLMMELGNSTQPYASVVNNSTGSLSAFSITINADSLRNLGTVSAGGFLSINARTAKLEGGRLSAANNLSIAAQDLKLNGYQQSSAAFYLAVSNSVNDTGVGANNTLICNNGFNLVTKPLLGDLFGTTLQTQAGQFKEVNHVWSAENRGASPAGFSNNVAIGHLVISAASSSFLTFEGSGANNALYVDYLDLRGAAQTNLQSVVAINTNLVIYFADANVPADSLDGKFADSLQPAGRLRWVSSFAGPNSSVLVQLLNGQTTKMNRALRFSTTLDSDGDGVPNAVDCYPLDATAWNCGSGNAGIGTVATVLSDSTSRSVSITWNGLPSGVCQAEYTADLSAPNWQPVMSYTNIAVSAGTLMILDRNIPSGELQRYYRIRYGP